MSVPSGAAGGPAPDLRRQLEEVTKELTALKAALQAVPGVWIDQPRKYNKPESLSKRLVNLATKPVDSSIVQAVHDEPTEDDDEVYKSLKKNEDAIDATAATQAKNWLAGITALIALVSTASVLSAPDASDLGSVQLSFVIIAAALGFAVLGTSLFYTYRAAYGTPGVVDKVEVRSAGGLRRYVNALRRQIAAETYRRLRIGLWLAAFGVSFALIANMIAWLPPFPKGDSTGAAKSLCVYRTSSDGTEVEVLRTTEKTLPLTQVPAGTVLKYCK